MSNAIIRGDSDVDTSTIGGEARVTASLTDIENVTLDSQLPGSATSGQGVQSTTSSILSNWDIPDDEADIYFVSTFDNTIYAYSLRLVSGTATSLASFTGSGTLTINFFLDWLDADGDLISSTAAAPLEINATTVASGNFVSGGVQLRALASDYPLFDGQAIPANAATFDYRVESVVTTGTLNWGLSGLFTPSAPRVSVPKPSGTAAYIASDAQDTYALTVRGGLGLRVEPVALVTLEGSDGVGQLQLSQGATSWVRDDEHRIIEVLIQYNQGTIVREASAVVTIPARGDLTFDTSRRLILYSFSAFGMHIATLNLLTVAATATGVTAPPFNTLELHAFNIDPGHNTPVFLRVWERMK